MFRILHKLELKWWQAALYETAMISLGILIGARWSHVFENWVIFFLLVFLGAGSYIFYIWWKQIKADAGKVESED